MITVQVYVSLKQGVLDPQGSAVKQSLNTLGFSEVEDVRIGKHLTLTIDAEEGEVDIEERVKQMCEKLLANPVIEDYEFTIEEVVTS
ncbi:phosphoribosylformylglycinamidine synthase subunit PurS [Texcoconibacillus texcoconensis]|uniref:Phosphoribosylformylglycinamidine synthase subunit PurS n=1 Tax=Texcoconibacillus texcoconensis TaxID=1095777 RepID=A0A840QMJ2_9BACI|nr:phosphoribosylformylglycinamidine synthase subunit PurS [Texcoconibacillus texcoconensis]MBB5172563.1 phosphoribosylformylglycinamidine synthase [Texcoconibacillus texcoconensis]